MGRQERTHPKKEEKVMTGANPSLRRRDKLRNQADRAWAVNVDYRGWNPDVDDAIYAAVGFASEDSRYGFGRRDHTWYFRYKKQADRAAKNITKAVGNQLGLNVRVYEF